MTKETYKLFVGRDLIELGGGAKVFFIKLGVSFSRYSLIARHPWYILYRNYFHYRSITKYQSFDIYKYCLSIGIVDSDR